MFSKKPDKLSQYIDPTGEFTNRELKFGEWYVGHKLLLQKIAKIVLSIWCIVTLGYSVSYIMYYVGVGYSADEAMYVKQTLEFENYKDLQVLYKPQDLQVKKTQVFAGAPGRYDFAAQVLNANKRWIAYISYRYQYSGGETEERQTVILPGEQRPVVFFGAESEVWPGEASLIMDTVWKKVSAHAIKDVESFVSERKIFTADNFKFTSARQANDVDSNVVEFDLTNTSPYSYWSPEFVIELYDGGVVGYLYAVEEKFRAGDMKHVDVRSLADNLEVSDIKVYSVIDIFSRSQYMQPGE